MRRKLVAGNWKMHGLRAQLSEVEAIAAATAQHEGVDVALCVPFTLIAPAVALATRLPISFAKPDARMVALIKPQFEAGRDEVGKGGVVRDPAVHARVCAEARAWATSKGWHVVGIEKSPITGPEGNVEFLLAANHGAPE